MRSLWRWLTGGWRYGAFLCGVGLISVTIAIRYGQVRRPGPDNDNLAGWALALALTGIASLIVGVLAVSSWGEERRFRGGDRKEVIRRLTENLKHALTAIEAIRFEVEEGERTLSEIEARVSTSRELAELSDSEARAVRKAIEDQFAVEARSNLRRDVVIALVSFGAGLAATVLLS